MTSADRHMRDRVAAQTCALQDDLDELVARLLDTPDGVPWEAVDASLVHSARRLIRILITTIAVRHTRTRQVTA